MLRDREVPNLNPIIDTANLLEQSIHPSRNGDIVLWHHNNEGYLKPSEKFLMGIDKLMCRLTH